MTIHDKCLLLVKKSKYNNRQLGEILGISTQGVANKVNKANNNSFNEKDFEKIIKFLKSLIPE